ncbi:MAG: AAA ATPase [Candidatus Wolfebacteria bacterium GW2011_GWC1_47_103]|nr:MAG: AAA ATPase [Candidatus Wolfebacteria bacterium GW2011_GWC1_47_103]
MTQDEAFAILKTGTNVFLTGEPGSGKSHMVNRYVEYLRSCGVEPSITASTGIAATHIGGMTLHAWCGIGVRTHLTDHDLELMLDKDRLVKRLRVARVLIIDEVSMLSGDTLALVEQVCRVLRDSAEPFGGLQVVLVGDFFQLPPIMPKADSERVKTISLDGEDQWSPFAFIGSAWAKADPTICYLTEQHRQEDPAFLQALSAIRRGEVTDAVRDCLNGRCTTPPSEDEYTKLYAHNFAVDRINDAYLRKLPGEQRNFAMTSSGITAIVDGLKRGCLSPETLSLKVGAKVMFTRNSTEGKFVNGTTGVVHNGKTIEAEQGEWSIFDGMKCLGMIKQIPLRLAWAITIHKSQGMSLDAAIIDLSQAFEFGQGYVALSRVRTLAGLYLLGYNERALEVHPDVFAQDIQFRAASEQARYNFAALGEEQIANLQSQFIDSIGGAVGMGMQAPASKVSTYDATAELVAQQMSIAEMAEHRGVSEGTLITHLEKLVASGTLNPEHDLEYLKPERRRFVTMQAALEQTYKKKGSMLLSPAQAMLGSDFTFEELRVVRLFLGKSEG